MVFTIDDSEPQCSASVSAVRSATLTLTAKDNQMTVYNLKAISCTGGRSSEVLGETYQLDPGPVVEATFPIEGDLSAADLQGDESLLESLLNGIAEVLGLDRERITSVKISDARRRLLAANVMLRFVAESQEAADNLAAAARQADYTGIPGPWVIGNPEVTVVPAPGEDVVITTTPPPKKSNKGLIIGLGVLGASIFLVSLAMAYVFWKRFSSKSTPKQSEFTLSDAMVSPRMPTSPSPDATSSQSHEDRLRSTRSPQTPHNIIESPPNAAPFGSDSTPSEPAPRPLTLDTSQKPPTGNTDWMEATTPPGTPPGDPDDSHEFVRGELVFADGAGVDGAFRQPPQAVSALPQDYGNLPARDMRRSLGDVDKWPGRESPSASGDAVMYSSNQLPQVNDNVTQEASQAPATRHDDMTAAVMDDLQHFTEERPSARGSIEATARSAYRDPTGHVVQPSNTTGQGGPPAQSFSADLFSSSQPSVTPSLQVDAQGSDEDTVDI